jgi:hypothetical protein
MSTPCGVCAKRATCRRLCSKAEKWTDQDYIGQRELSGYQRPVEIEESEGGGSNDWLETVEFHTHLNSTSGSWEDYVNASHAPFPRWPCLTDVENEIIQKFYTEGATYDEIAEWLSYRLRRGSRGRAKVSPQTR